MVDATHAQTTQALASNLGAIVGGAVGGCVLLGLVLGLVVFWVIHLRKRLPDDSSMRQQSQVAAQRSSTYDKVVIEEYGESSFVTSIDTV